MKQQSIEEKLKKLGVERGSGSNVPQIFAPHARAASVISFHLGNVSIVPMIILLDLKPRGSEPSPLQAQPASAVKGRLYYQFAYCISTTIFRIIFSFNHVYSRIISP
jgi:hypothetical protein